MIDSQDSFLLKVQKQIKRGTRHHFEDNISRCHNEFRDLLSLQATKMIITGFDWWMYRAHVLATDRAISLLPLTNNWWSVRN